MIFVSTLQAEFLDRFSEFFKAWWKTLVWPRPDSILQLIHPDWRAPNMKLVKKMKAGGLSVLIESRDRYTRICATDVVSKTVLNWGGGIKKSDQCSYPNSNQLVSSPDINVFGIKNEWVKKVAHSNLCRGVVENLLNSLATLSWADTKNTIGGADHIVDLFRRNSSVKLEGPFLFWNIFVLINATLAGQKVKNFDHWCLFLILRTECHIVQGTKVDFVGERVEVHISISEGN